MSNVPATKSESASRFILTFHKVQLEDDILDMRFGDSRFVCQVERVPEFSVYRMFTQNSELREKFAAQGDVALVEWMEANPGYYVSVNYFFPETVHVAGQVFRAHRGSKRSRSARGERSTRGTRC